MCFWMFFQQSRRAEELLWSGQKIFHLCTAIVHMEIWYQCVEPSEWWHFSFEMTIRGALIRYFTFTLNRTFSNIQLSLSRSQKSSYSFGATSADASRHIHFNKLQNHKHPQVTEVVLISTSAHASHLTVLMSHLTTTSQVTLLDFQLLWSLLPNDHSLAVWELRVP